MSGFTLSSAVLIAACGNGTDGKEGAVPAEVGSVGAMENYQAGDTFVATEPLELEILYRDLPAYPLDKEWMFFEDLDEWDGVQEQIDNLRFQDGKYYVLPGINENVQFDFSLAYNKTVFDEYGLEEPQSSDELRSVLEVLKEETGSTAPMTL